MTIEPGPLRTVIAAAEYGSFRRAAAALEVKQSTLSRRVRRLEEQLGIKLFERSSGGGILRLGRRCRAYGHEPMDTSDGVPRVLFRGRLPRINQAVCDVRLDELRAGLEELTCMLRLLCKIGEGGPGQCSAPSRGLFVV